MTSGVDLGGSGPTGGDQRSRDLGEELVRRHSKTEYGQTQHRVTCKGNPVVPQGVRNVLLDEQVLGAIDLHDDSKVVPPDVEIDVARSGPPYDLPARFRQAATTAFASEVDLTHGVRTAEQVENDRLEETTPLVTPDLQQRCADGLGSHQPLLHGHGQQGGRLAVRPGPQSGMDGGHVDAYPRDADWYDVFGPPPPRLPYNRVAQPGDAGPTRNRHPDGGGLPTLQAGQGQGTDAVDDRSRTGLEDSAPVRRAAGQVAGVHCDRLAAVRAPSCGPQLRRDLPSRECGGVELAARDDTVLSVGELSYTGAPRPSLTGVVRHP